MCPCKLGILGGRCFAMRSSVRPGQDMKWLFLIALTNVRGCGERHAACRYFANSTFVCFFLKMTFALCYLLACDSWRLKILSSIRGFIEDKKGEIPLSLFDLTLACCLMFWFISGFISLMNWGMFSLVEEDVFSVLYSPLMGGIV